MMEQARGWENAEEAGEEGGMPPSSPARVHGDLRPVPEPEVRAQRRQISTAYKLRILQEADACKGPGEVNALLRREGLYSSHLCQWRKLRRLGTLGQMRGRKVDPDAELKKRIKELERDNERLQGKLRQAAKIIEIQKKVSEVLGVSLEQTDSSDEIS
jgi:transposase